MVDRANRALGIKLSLECEGSELAISSDDIFSTLFQPMRFDTILPAHCSADHVISLHDIQTGTALKKILLQQMCSNSLEWNPIKPMIFVVGNEDYQMYSFDMHRLDQPTYIYKGHQGAIKVGLRQVRSLSRDPTITLFASLKQIRAPPETFIM